MRSMTGFGQARGESSRYAVSVTLRSVNGRFLDPHLRLREELRTAEPRLRELLAARLHRGRVEVTVEARQQAGGEVVVEVRDEVVRALHRGAQHLFAAGLVRNDLTLGDLLRCPEAVTIRLGEAEWREEDQGLLEAVLEEALTALEAAREAEGGRLALALSDRLEQLEALRLELEELEPQVQLEIRAGLERRLGELLGEQPVDQGRLAQEAAVLVDRSDVREELDRLRSHLEHLREVLAASGPVGKKLDFLVQEIGRELNTLGAKSRHVEVTRRVLAAKHLAEQLREQIQNVE